MVHLRRRRRRRGGAGRPVPGAGAARLRTGRGRGGRGPEWWTWQGADRCAAARHPAAPDRRTVGRGRCRRLARARLGGVQGRRALLRRGVRDRPADAARRGPHLSLDDLGAVPERGRARPGDAGTRRRDRRGGRLCRPRAWRRRAGGRDRVRALVRVRADRRQPFPAAAESVRAQAFLDGAGPAAIGAILGSAIPLAEALRHGWQFGLLAAPVLWHCCSRAAAWSRRCSLPVRSARSWSSRGLLPELGAAARRYRCPNRRKPRHRGFLLSRPISRILSRAVIHLSGLPGPWRATYKRSCSALHQVGFTWPPRRRDAGALLPHHFTLTGSGTLQRPQGLGGVISVALSRGFPRVGVTDHLAL